MATNIATAIQRTYIQRVAFQSSLHALQHCQVQCTHVSSSPTQERDRQRVVSCCSKWQNLGQPHSNIQTQTHHVVCGTVCTYLFRIRQKIIWKEFLRCHHHLVRHQIQQSLQVYRSITIVPKLCTTAWWEMTREQLAIGHNSTHASSNFYNQHFG